MGEDWYTCSECGEPTSDYSDVNCGNEKCDNSFCYSCAEKMVSIFGKSKKYDDENPIPLKCYECAINKREDEEIKKFEKKITNAEKRKDKLEKQMKEYIVKKYKENEKKQ